MKLEATCQNCGRRFLLAQILPEPEGTGGRCPFCGYRFGRHYLPMLPRVIDTAEQAADTFLSSLEHLRDMHPGFHVDYGVILKRLGEELANPSERTA